MHHLFSMALRAAAVAVLIPVVLVLVIDTQAPLGHIATSLAAVSSLATIVGHYAALGGTFPVSSVGTATRAQPNRNPAQSN